MRPEQIALEERYGASLKPDDITAHEKALKELNKEYGYNPLSGCIPPLVQLPFILGLYRLLIWMSVPENGRAARCGISEGFELVDMKHPAAADGAVWHESCREMRPGQILSRARLRLPVSLGFVTVF